MNDNEEVIKARLFARLKELRKAKKLSFRKMGLAMDMDASQYEKLEKGQHVPGLITLCSIAEALGITVSELVKGIDSKS